MKNIIKFACLILFSCVFFVIPPQVYSLEELSKDEMKTTTGQRALTDFSITGNTTRMFINTHIETHAEIDSLKLGFYDRAGTHDGVWDQNWTNLEFGSADNNLKMDGFILRADFNNLNDNNPELKRLIIGTNRLDGTIKGNFNSFTGAYNPSLTATNSDDDTEGNIYTRKNLGSKEFNFKSSSSGKDQGFFLILSPNAANNAGIHSFLGYTEQNITEAFTNNTEEWWHSP